MKLQIGEQMCTCHSAYFYIIHHCIANSEYSRVSMKAHIGDSRGSVGLLSLCHHLCLHFCAQHKIKSGENRSLGYFTVMLMFISSKFKITTWVQGSQNISYLSLNMSCWGRKLFLLRCVWGWRKEGSIWLKKQICLQLLLFSRISREETRRV